MCPQFGSISRTSQQEIQSLERSRGSLRRKLAEVYEELQRSFALARNSVTAQHKLLVQSPLQSVDITTTVNMFKFCRRTKHRSAPQNRNLFHTGHLTRSTLSCTSVAPIFTACLTLTRTSPAWVVRRAPSRTGGITYRRPSRDLESLLHFQAVYVYVHTTTT